MVYIDAEVNIRIALASDAFERLLEEYLGLSGISLTTKLKVYSALVMTCTDHSSLHLRDLSCLRRRLHIRWRGKILDTKVLEKACIPSVHTLQKAKVRWAGHVARMPDSRLPKPLLYGEIWLGKASVGGRRNVSKTASKRFSKT